MAPMTITTRKSVQGYTWENTWHISAIDMSDAIDAATAVCTYEASFLGSGCLIDEAKVSNWPNPNNQGFVIVPMNMQGLRTLNNPQPAEMCLFLNITAQNGHPGKKWLRMSLDESDTTTLAGKATLASNSGIYVIDGPARDNLVSGLSAVGVSLLIGSNPLTARTWSTQIQTIGVGFRDTDVGWYNRTTP